jgi:DNA helicase HerA-like ATPase
VSQELEVDLHAIISEQERQDLARLTPPPPDLGQLLGGCEFVRVNTVASFWEGRENEGTRLHAMELAIAAHGYGNYLTFVVCGDGRGTSIYFHVESADVSAHLLHSAYPGIVLAAAPAIQLQKDLASNFRHAGMISGVPSIAGASGEKSAPRGDEPRFHFERAIRGMRGARWAFVVQAFPRSGEDPNERRELLDRMSALSSVARQQVQRSIQESRSPRNRETQSASEVRGGELVDRHAEYGVELLERALKRSERAIAVGRWQTAVYYGAENQRDAARLGAVLSSLFSGPESRPSPIRVHPCASGAAPASEQFHTYLTSEELALEIMLPREEAPGLAVVDYAPFDVCAPAVTNGVALGDILWDDRKTGEIYQVPVADLTRHGVVFGVTGSGKTTTLLGLLSSLTQPPRRVPFLVIEPAKTEYRSLLGGMKDGKPDGPIPHLRVFTLGNDTVAPFRLNPFEFDLPETYAPVPVLSHIDFLKAVFNAAFILYAPMPYVLDMALHEIYEDKGWNLATGINVRLPAEEWAQRDRYPIYPTLTDLYGKVESVTRRLGYEAKVEQDVVAGLKARVGSLRLGAKGLMLDTPRGVPMADLLGGPVALELEHIGNDDEKTFIMGLILARLYGFRRLQAAEGKQAAGLEHLLIIEEAHRLLKNTSTNVETDAANLRAQAIETFVNMLSEVRHYGQGVLVAEQIPAKLTPDVVKNTNLKVIHRLLAQDDRELVGKTMNMNEGQTRRLAWLRRGQAAVFAEGDDHPILVEVDNFRLRQAAGSPRDAALADHADHYIVLQPYLRVPSLDLHGIRLGRLSRPDPMVYQEITQQLSRDDTGGLWARLLLQIVFARKSVPATVEQMRQDMVAAARQLNPGQHAPALQMLLALGADEALQARGGERGWSFATVDGLRGLLTSGLLRLVRTRDLSTTTAELDRFARGYEARLRDSQGPCPGCRNCCAPCVYGTDIRRLLAQSDLYAVRGTLSDRTRSRSERNAGLATMLRATVRRWLGADPAGEAASSENNNMAYCAALLAGKAIGMDLYEQEDFGQEMAGKLLA